MNGIMATANEELRSDLHARLDSFRQSDEARNAFIDNLVREYQILHEKYQEKCDDLTNEVTSRRQWQSHAAAVKRDLDSLHQQTDANAFALAIIDGDGAIFQDQLLRAGADGGSEAGYNLYGEIKRHLAERHGPVGNWTIMVQIYANFEGLSRKLAQVGIVRSPVDLHAFARAFSCNQPLFSFIDVGTGKERADHKIKGAVSPHNMLHQNTLTLRIRPEMLRLFMFNIHCKHIIFGGAHDNGYLPNLEPFKRDEGVTSKLTLLATTPPERGFLDLGMDVIKFSSVFRNDQLPDTRFLPNRSLSTSAPTAPNQPPQPALPVVPLPPVFSPTTESPLPTPQVTTASPPQPGLDGQSQSTEDSPKPLKVLPVNQQPTPPAANHVKSPPPDAPPVPKAAAVSPAPDQAKPTSYADISSNTANSKQISIAPEKPTKPRKAVYLNAYDQRVDLTIPKPESAAITSLHQRIKAKKVCNNFHLLNYCSSGVNCPYSHEPRLSARETAALRQKARDRPCNQGLNCRDPDCLSGHMCPRGKDCDFDYCYFGDDAHGVDKAIKMKYYNSGDIEIVH